MGIRLNRPKVAPGVEPRVHVVEMMRGGKMKKFAVKEIEFIERRVLKPEYTTQYPAGLEGGEEGLVKVYHIRYDFNIGYVHIVEWQDPLVRRKPHIPLNEAEREALEETAGRMEKARPDTPVKYLYQHEWMNAMEEEPWKQLNEEVERLTAENEELKAFIRKQGASERRSDLQYMLEGPPAGTC